MVYLPQKLYVINIREEGLTGTGGSTLFLDNMAVIDRFCIENPDFELSHRKVVQKSRQIVLLQLGRFEFGEKDYREAQRIFLRALALAPSMNAIYMLMKASWYRLIA